MKEHLKHFFIPHSGNDYHPHVLHTKRAALYGGLFVTMKVIVVAFVLLVPAEVYVMPDVLAQQEKIVFALTNDVRSGQGIGPLQIDERLERSAMQKGADMVEKSYFAHTSPDGVGLASWLQGVNYPYQVAGENLAIGFRDARAMVRAWVESPTHFANLVDEEYEDTGIRLVAGVYDGESVVFAVHHFGAEKQGQTGIASVNEAESRHTFVPTEESDTPPSSTESVTFADVLGTQEDMLLSSDTVQAEDAPAVPSSASGAPVSDTTEPKEIPFLDTERSYVSYEVVPGEQPQLRLTAHAGINAPYTMAVVHIGEHEIPLGESDTYGIAEGSIVIDETGESYFRAVLVPQLQITLTDGTVITEPLAWEHIPKVSLTPVEQYTTSKSLLSSLTSLFTVTRSVYFFFILFFTVALLIHMLWEVRVQHHHITVQTLGLILLLITLSVI